MKPSLIWMLLFTICFPALTALRSDTNAVAVDHILKDLGYREAKAAYLLAFTVEIDDRPLYLEKALVAIEFETNRWRLANVYRHPREKMQHEWEWKISYVTDVPYRGSRDYDHRPSKAETEAFLRESWWDFRAHEGFRFLRAEVYAGAWEKALHYTPKHKFPALDRRK